MRRRIGVYNLISLSGGAGKSCAVVAERLSRASLCWHATDYGSLADREAEKQEHFGITVVEAMPAEAVPVTLNSSGPRETVQHECSGFLWNNRAELQRYTELLPSDRALPRRNS